MRNIEYVLVIMGIVFFGLFPLRAHGLVITEIMYDTPSTDTDREWIEVFNDGVSGVDVVRFKLFENNVNHTITTPATYANPSNALAPGTYAVVADNVVKFLEDWPDFSGLLFDSAFSLTNTGETLKLVDSGGLTVDTREYSGELGAKGDGMSLQFHEGVFIAAQPTPGARNATVAEDVTPEPTVGTVEDNGVSSHSEQVDIVVVKEKPTVAVSAGRARIGTIHKPFIFNGTQDDNSLTGKITFLWNFGDGNVGKGRTVQHSYKHSGTYNVVLNAISGRERAVSRTEVSVVEPSVSFAVATSTVNIGNTGSFELNLGGFIIDGLAKPYVFPKDTIISPKQTISFDHSIFPSLASSTPTLLFPNKKPVIRE
jgi:hypothetical protein